VSKCWLRTKAGPFHASPISLCYLAARDFFWYWVPPVFRRVGSGIRCTLLYLILPFSFCEVLFSGIAPGRLGCPVKSSGLLGLGVGKYRGVLECAAFRT